MVSKNVSALHERSISEIVDEYAYLFSLPELSVIQQKKMADILEFATQNDELDFWISKRTCEEGGKLGLQDEDSQQSYNDQRALMSERIDTKKPEASMIPGPTLESLRSKEWVRSMVTNIANEGT